MDSGGRMHPEVKQIYIYALRYKKTTEQAELDEIHCLLSYSLLTGRAVILEATLYAD